MARPTAAATASGRKAVSTTLTTGSATLSGTSRTGEMRTAETSALSAADDVTAVSTRSASPATMSQATTRHRGDGSRPSGNSRTASTNRKPSSPRIAPSQSAQATDAGAAPVLIAYLAKVSVATPTATLRPSARNSQPIGLAGRWLATIAPTTANASSSGVKANAFIRSWLATPNQALTASAATVSSSRTPASHRAVVVVTRPPRAPGGG